jgi:hypothetical protein
MPKVLKPVLPKELPLIVRDYFLNLNEGHLEQIAAHFREDGILYSPLDGAIRGREAILAYLHDHSQGMTCYPDTVVVSNTLIVVSGHVSCSAFQVNVEWTFCLYNNHIKFLKVKLLASLQELLTMK